MLSRTTDATTVLMAVMGTGLGALGVRQAERRRFDVTQVPSGVWLRACGVWLAVMLCVFWLPFDFDLSRLTWAGMTDAFTRTPLNNYYFASEFIALNEVLRKIGFFVPLGLLWGLAGRAPRAGRGDAALRSHWPLLWVAFGVECAQLLLPARVADLTDFLLESLGGVMGLRMATWLTTTAPPRPIGAGGAPQPVAASLKVEPARPAKPMTVPKPGVFRLQYVAGLALTSLALGVLLHLPAMPYNVRELVASGLAGVLSVVGLTLALHWMANAVFVLLEGKHRPWLMLLPFTLVVHGLLNWLFLRMGVPLESIHDVVGSPVLGWPWEWELMGRYLCLHLAMMLQIVGAVLLVRAVLQPRHLATFLYWGVICALLCWPLYVLNVTLAATDNLVELIAGDASFAASSALMLGFFTLCTVASAVSAALAVQGRHRLRAGLAGLALMAALLASWMFWLGSEPVLVKYGRAFSAFQFLLSTDRAHYATGMNLVTRYLMAFGGTVAGLACLQWMCWRRLWVLNAPPLSR